MTEGRAAQVARRNIEAIRDMEMRAVRQRTTGERISDWISYNAGKPAFVALHVLVFLLWVAWNVSWSPFGPKIDPYPFTGLTTVASLEAIVLSWFILVSQNRSSRRADERAHLDLQINLLAEHETTKMLQMLQSICRKLNLPEAQDGEVTSLIERTRPEELADQLAETLPDPAASLPPEQDLENASAAARTRP